MQIDLQRKAKNLLETIANSIYDREQQPSNSFSFSNAEVQAAKDWLYSFVRDLHKYRIDI